MSTFTPPSSIAIGKMSFSSIVILFLVYVFCHIGIVLYHKYLSNLKKLDDDEKKLIKAMGFLHKWFPTLYVVFIVLTIYPY